MPKWAVYFMNAVAAGVISGGAVISQALLDHGSVSKTSLLVAGLAGLMSMAKDVQSHSSTPPN